MADSGREHLSPAEHPCGRVLVVDDEAVIRMAATYILEYAGYAVECAIHGADALSLVRESSVDAILLDLQMPVMDGFEFLRAIAVTSTLTNTRIVVMSADHVSRRRVLQMGAHAFVHKPFRVHELLQSVRGS